MLAELADASPDAHAQLERQDSAQMLRDLVRDSLTEVEARVMTLHYAEDLPLDAVTQTAQPGKYERGQSVYRERQAEAGAGRQTVESGSARMMRNGGGHNG